ncbi:MAG TPA: hypothetical protein VJ878_02375, partial [Candidatus Izemoplasmatales bacterium]|nr:hypothetical protein [Candidatus Izemoplasmatales bacterium]
MEIAVRLKTKDEIAQLIQLGADIMMLDTDDLTAKAIMPLSKDRFAQIHHEIKKHKKKTYIWINKMIHEPDLKRLDNWLSLIKNLDIDG